MRGPGRSLGGGSYVFGRAGCFSGNGDGHRLEVGLARLVGLVTNLKWLMAFFIHCQVQFEP
jgi:hypothetical protein